MVPSTVSGLLTPSGMGRLGRLGQEPTAHYERGRPGELIHIDVKKLGRIQGGGAKQARGGVRGHYTLRVTDAAGRVRKTVALEFVHVAIDDATRLAYVGVLNDEKAATAVDFPVPRAQALQHARHHRQATDHR
jgi:hypothetical protein